LSFSQNKCLNSATIASKEATTCVNAIGPDSHITAQKNTTWKIGTNDASPSSNFATLCSTCTSGIN